MGRFIRTEVHAKVATLTINNPPLNLLTGDVFKELESVLDELQVRKDVKCLVLTGAGQVFVAGADIRQIARIQSADDGRKAAAEGRRIFRKIELMEKPVIAAINGVCLGGGLEMAMACHIRWCSENARFGQPEIDLGIIPGFGGTQRLARLVGKGKALEMILTGKDITPQEAKALNLVNHIFPDSEVLARAKELAEKIAAKPAVAIRQALKTISSGLEQSSMDSALDIELEGFGKCCDSLDMKEGTSAFMEKRKPQFKDQ